MPDNLERTLSEYEERERQKKDEAKAVLLALADQLRAAGVCQVCAAFSGYGDEGSVESIEFLDPQGESLGGSLGKQFPDLEYRFYCLIPTGFEDNGGSSGTVRLDVERGRIVVDVDWNVTTSENEHYEV